MVGGVSGSLLISYCIIHYLLERGNSQTQNSSGELGDVGDGGRLSCLHGKVDNTISCMCTCSVGSTQCSGCVVYGPGAMAAILLLLERGSWHHHETRQ